MAVRRFALGGDSDGSGGGIDAITGWNAGDRIDVSGIDGVTGFRTNFNFFPFGPFSDSAWTEVVVETDGVDLVFGIAGSWGLSAADFIGLNPIG